MRSSTAPTSTWASAIVLTLTIGLAASCGPANDRASTSTSGSGTQASSGTGGAGGMVPRPDPTSSRATASLSEGRSHHTATLLHDGRVVVVGGEDAAANPIGTVEVFDPTSESWSSLSPLPEARSNHTATLLTDDHLLIVGGGHSNQNGSPSPDGVLSTAVLYDPESGASSELALGGPRAGHQAFELADGGVLIVGGSSDQFGSACTSVPDCSYGKALASAERFDVTTQAFTAAAPMVGPRMLFGGVVLSNGAPLLVGGANDSASLASVESFAADTNTFSSMSGMAHARLRPVVARLGNGMVIAAAGKIANVGPIGVTEIYDPTANAWSAGPSIGTPRTASAAVTLETGNALVVGGYDQISGATLDESLIFDASLVAWTHLPPLVRKRALPTATVLLDGRVLIVGGSGGVASCEIAE